MLSNNFVYFDDFKVTITPTNILQSSEYYPFGSQTANSWTRDNTSTNFLANGGTELNTTSSLYDLDYRNFDPVLGRMHQIDPMGDYFASHTPYNYSFNSPVMFNDPSGAVPIQRIGNTLYINWDETGEFGGTWYPAADAGGGGSWTAFTSDNQAFAAGALYNDRFNSWGNTAYGSEAGTTLAYLWAKATGQVPTTAAIDYNLSRGQALFAASNSGFAPASSSNAAWNAAIMNAVYGIIEQGAHDLGQWTRIPSYISLSDGRQVDVTFNYKTADGKSGDQLIRQITLDVLIDALEATPGITSIDISASTNGNHSCSCHRDGLALDIDAFNGTYVRDAVESVNY